MATTGWKPVVTCGLQRVIRPLTFYTGMNSPMFTRTFGSLLHVSLTHQSRFGSLLHVSFTHQSRLYFLIKRVMSVFVFPSSFHGAILFWFHRELNPSLQVSSLWLDSKWNVCIVSWIYILQNYEPLCDSDTWDWGNESRATSRYNKTPGRKTLGLTENGTHDAESSGKSTSHFKKVLPHLYAIKQLLYYWNVFVSFRFACKVWVQAHIVVSSNWLLCACFKCK